MNYILVNNQVIEYTIIKKVNKKHITITIQPNKQIIVTSPKAVTTKEITNLLHQKSLWILKKLAEISARPSAITKQFLEGEMFPYLGNEYPLRISKYVSTNKRKGLSLHFTGRDFHAQVDAALSSADYMPLMTEQFKIWYISRGNELLTDRLSIYCPLLGLNPKRVTFKEQKRRWGSCNSSGVIYLNWRLLMAPIEIVDYVLVHELAHLKHMNHSKQFWELVESLFPDYKTAKSWLKEHGPCLTLAHNT